MRKWLALGLAGVIATSLFGNDAYAKPIKLPKVGAVDTQDKIIPKGNFTWGEATKGGTRIPDKEYIVDNIISTAYEMEKIRAFFGDRPIIITSWYRDPVTNSKLPGAAPHSEHMNGNAVDFNVRGLSAAEVHKGMKKYRGNKGGLGKYTKWVHYDRGRFRDWEGK